MTTMDRTELEQATRRKRMNASFRSINDHEITYDISKANKIVNDQFYLTIIKIASSSTSHKNVSLQLKFYMIC